MKYLVLRYIYSESRTLFKAVRMVGGEISSFMKYIRKQGIKQTVYLLWVKKSFLH